MTKFKFKPETLDLLIPGLRDMMENFELPPNVKANDVVVHIGRSKEGEEPSYKRQVKKTVDFKSILTEEITIDFLKKYFSFFVTMTNKKGESFLTMNQVEQFIERAFLGNKDIPKIEFNARYGEYNRIVYYFFILFTICQGEYKGVSQTEIKNAFQHLLIDNFTEFGDVNYVLENFHKAPKNPKTIYKISRNDKLREVKSILNSST